MAEQNENSRTVSGSSEQPAMSARAKAGRCFNGAERDQGVVTHAVPCAAFPSWEKALCGTRPGQRGNGWKVPASSGEVTCIRCLKKLAH